MSNVNNGVSIRIRDRIALPASFRLAQNASAELRRDVWAFSKRFNVTNGARGEQRQKVYQLFNMYQQFQITNITATFHPFPHTSYSDFVTMIKDFDGNYSNDNRTLNATLQGVFNAGAGIIGPIDHQGGLTMNNPAQVSLAATQWCQELYDGAPIFSYEGEAFAFLDSAPVRVLMGMDEEDTFVRDDYNEYINSCMSPQFKEGSWRDSMSVSWAPRVLDTISSEVEPQDLTNASRPIVTPWMQTKVRTVDDPNAVRFNDDISHYAFKFYLWNPFVGVCSPADTPSMTLIHNIGYIDFDMTLSFKNIETRAPLPIPVAAFNATQFVGMNYSINNLQDTSLVRFSPGSNTMFTAGQKRPRLGAAPDSQSKSESSSAVVGK
uniref:Capsid protein n=1 Tax=Cressdnaviricota sp. TaxID=2748378 RepID=A0A6M9Z8R7_9VIRU|nr:MAG: capsid protein [Cressdnaviricota sp.]